LRDVRQALPFIIFAGDRRNARSAETDVNLENEGIPLP